MFKYYSIKKYGAKLLPTLEKRYGKQKYYSASQVRTTVYQNDFNPKYLPLAYLLFLDNNTLRNVLFTEYPELNISQYKNDIGAYIARKKYDGYLQNLNTDMANQQPVISNH
tara:strand:+ start:449 stop:781 length:333 start_codon:yes stop_codon:yes gene_type:complete